MACCTPFELTLGENCPPPIIDDVHQFKLGDPTSPQKPGNFFVNYPIHLKAGDYVWIRIFSYNQSVIPPFCNPCVPPNCAFPSSFNDPYLVFMDSSNTILVQRYGQNGAAVQIGIFIEIEDDYIIQSTNDQCPGTTGFNRTTVWTDCGELNWTANGIGAGQGTGPVEWAAPQSVQPLTWAIIPSFGSVCSELLFQQSSSLFPLIACDLSGFCRDPAWPRLSFTIRVTDANGLQRSRTVKFNNMAFVGYRTSPTYLLSPPLGTPYQIEFVTSGGVPPYTLSFDPAFVMPGGLTLGPSASGQNAVLSGTWDGTGMPAQPGWGIVDANLNFSGVGITLLTCTGQHPISALIWNQSNTIPNPGAGDSITGSASGGDGSWVLENKYAGGPCVTNPTVMTVTAQLCNPTPNTEYTVELQALCFGSMGNEPACPAIGSAALEITGFGNPSQAFLSGTGGQLYSFQTDLLTAVVPPGGVVNVQIQAQVVYSEMNLSFTFRPLTHP